VLVGLAQDLNLPRLAVSAQPRAVERVDAQKDEQADDTDQHRNCRLISPRLRLCENPADRALKPPVLLVAEIHDRMPLILPPGAYARWLGEQPDPRDLMRPFPSEPMRMWPISTRVNKPENDDASIVEPINFAVDAA
jgi:hypothetical protein